MLTHPINPSDTNTDVVILFIILRRTYKAIRGGMEATKSTIELIAVGCAALFWNGRPPEQSLKTKI
ncbi:hypothetical protein JIN85_20615 [Luteolibacter pohnpeiensis]|uniref:Uncharacterized protein n=1 Tax=Luteolibacter pohnpeiensis TaxID=454153 RepID=A0A934VXX2_9BACT|nr:hypothetical protein [Luteolibacter pohnpeiensis]